MVGHLFQSEVMREAACKLTTSVVKAAMRGRDKRNVLKTMVQKPEERVLTEEDVKEECLRKKTVKWKNATQREGRERETYRETERVSETYPEGGRRIAREISGVRQGESK